MYRDQLEHCPACATALETVGDRRSCPACGGVWISEVTLTELVLDMHQGIEASGLVFAPRRGSAARACPTCQQPMEVAALERVPVERCRRSDGVWLDAGALAAVLYNASQRPPRPGFGGAPRVIARAAPRPIIARAPAPSTAPAAPAEPVEPASATPDADVLVHHATFDGEVYRFDSAAMTLAHAADANARFGLRLTRGLASVWLTGDAMPSPPFGGRLVGVLAFDPDGLDRLATMLLGRSAALRLAARLHARARWSGSEVAAWVQFDADLVDGAPAAGGRARALPPTELGFIARVEFARALPA